MSPINEVIEAFRGRHGLSWSKACRIIGCSPYRKYSGHEGTYPLVESRIRKGIADYEAALEDSRETAAASADDILQISHLGPVSTLHSYHASRGALLSQQALLSLCFLAAVKFVWKLKAAIGNQLLASEVTSKLRPADGVLVRIITADSPMWSHKLRLWSVPGHSMMLFSLHKVDSSNNELERLLEGEFDEAACEKLLALLGRPRKNKSKRNTV